MLIDIDKEIHDYREHYGHSREFHKESSLFETLTYLILRDRDKIRSFNFIDVGANIGIYTRYVHFLTTNCFTQSFEPEDAPYEIMLMWKMMKSKDNALVYPFGLWSKRTACPFYHRERDYPNQKKTNQVSGFMPHPFDGVGASGMRMVLPLAHFTSADPVDFVKIDTVGSEVEIVKGMIPKLNPVQYKTIFIEAHAKYYDGHELIALLRDHGYQIYNRSGTTKIDPDLSKFYVYATTDEYLPDFLRARNRIRQSKV